MALPGLVAAHINFQLLSLRSSAGVEQVGDSVSELLSLCEPYGEDAHVLLLCGLLESKHGDGADAKASGNAVALALARLVDAFHDRGYFARALAVAADRGLVGPKSKLSWEEFSTSFCASTSHRLALATALWESRELAAVEFAKKAFASAGEGKIDATCSPLVAHRAILLLTREQSPLAAKLLQAASGVDLTQGAWSLLQPLVQAGTPGPRPGKAKAGEAAKPSLAALMAESGAACTSTAAVFRKLAGLAAPVDERAAAEVLGLVCSSPGVAGSGGSRASEGLAALLGEKLLMDDKALAWNEEVVVEGLKEAAPGVRWEAALHALDYPGFHVSTADGFTRLLRMSRELTGAPFPAAAVCSRGWANPKGQLSFMEQAVSRPTNPALLSLDASVDVQPSSVEAELGARVTPWLCTAVLDAIYEASDQSPEAFQRAAGILEAPKELCPEALLVSSASCRAKWTKLCRQTTDWLLQRYMAGHPGGGKAMERAWAADQACVVRGLVAEYTRDPTTTARALDICQEHKMLVPVLKLSPYGFMLDLAALAARREYLNLEKWLVETVNDRGQTFVASCLDFMDDKFKPNDGRPGPRIYLSSESAQILLQFLLRYQDRLREPQAAQLKRVVAQMGTMQNVPGGAAASGFAPDVEEEANANFQSIYNGQLATRDAIAMLTRLKGSAVDRERDVFACMLHNLFDEYRFFPKYPDKELRITAQLFGELIQSQLVSSITLSIALRYILDAIAKPPAEKMFTFGKHALEQFMPRLHEWPKFRSHLLMVPNIRQSFPSLVQYLESSQPAGRQEGAAGALSGPGMGGIQSEAYNIPHRSAVPFEPHTALKQVNSSSAAAAAAAAAAAVAAAAVRTGAPAQPQATEAEMLFQGADLGRSPPRFSPPSSGLPSLTSGGTKLDGGLHLSLNSEALETAALKQDFAVPSEQVSDKVQFLVNNLSATNLDEKAEAIDSLISDKYYAWFANYMIVKRVAQEPNFHALYLGLLDRLNSPELQAEMVQTTVQYIKILLGSDRIKVQSSDRTLLKNLGSWLGNMTIAKNKPLLQKMLDLKKFILEAYDKGKMIAVIPFVHKVLEPARKSVVFQPPNPWVMALCSVFTEIYGISKLKLNLKFEIEMLFKNLGLQIADVEPSKLVSGRTREVYGNPDFTVDKAAPPAAPPGEKPSAAVLGAASAAKPLEAGAAAAADPLRAGTAAGALAAPDGDAAVPGDWTNFVKISTSAFSVIPGIKRFFANAMDAAVREVIAPVVERSVTISCMTTRELVLKDFAFEPDENKLRQASRLMVAALAGSLALVTCKEPLRASLTNHLWQLLHQSQVPDTPEDVVEQTVGAEVVENLDFCCSIIERHAIDRAIRSIDEALSGSYLLRQKHAEVKSGQPFVDSAALQGKLPSLPEILHPRLGGQRYHVYKEFSKAGRLTNVPEVSTAAVLAARGERPKDEPAAALAPAAAPAFAEGQAKNLGALLAQVDKAVAKASHAPALQAATFDLLPPGHELRKLVQSVCDLLAKFVAARPEMGDQTAEQILAALLAAGAPLTKLRAGAHLQLLVALKPLVSDLDTKLARRFGMAGEEVWVHKDLAESMVRKGLLSLKEVDRALQSLILTRRFGAPIDFAIHCVRQCIVLEPLVPAAEMPLTLEVLAKIAAQRRGNGAGDALAQLVEQARRSTGSGTGGAAQGSKAPGAEELSSALAGKDGKGKEGGKEPPGALQEQAAFILDEWSKICDLPNRDKMATGLLITLQQSGFLKSDETAEQFFKILVEIAVSHCTASEAPAGQGATAAGGASGAAAGAGAAGGSAVQPLSFKAVDAFVKLVAYLINRSGNDSDTVNPGARGVRRAAQLFRVLGVIVSHMQKTSADASSSFNPRPYFRMFIGWYMELLEADTSDEMVTAPLLATLSDALMALQPLRVPAFAFCWLELISHRSFMPKLLLAPRQAGWTHFQKLLIALLQFLEPYLRNANLTESVRLLYKGTLRMLLVLLHDFPEFLCKFHFQLCDVIPSSCIQMRNLMLSAFPRNMRLPDPFTPNLKVDLLPEIAESPDVAVDLSAALEKQGLPVQFLATYLRVRQPNTFAQELGQKLLLGQPEAQQAGVKYNVPLMNAVVLYVGVNAIHNKGQQQVNVHLELFQHLLAEVDAEGRYLLLNAIANQLRYPNSHTHYFSCVLLYLFAESTLEVVKEQITRVLLERLIVNRPHPWGLLITFIELIKNPRYQFWSHPFTRCAPEVERLFENVARSCIGSGQKQGEAGAEAAEGKKAGAV